MDWLAAVAGLCALVGLGQACVGSVLLRRFLAQTPPAPAHRPAVTLLKPLHGAEPLLEQALASNFVLNWPALQIVFGVARADDPALAVVESLRLRFPLVDVAVVVNAQRHGVNGKIGNLINMLPAAKHDILVIADSDVHVGPAYLDRVVAALQLPEAGLATVPYCGLPAGGWAARLGAAGITHGFLPSALLARAMGRQDCLGATMALRRETLAAIGGLEALVNHVADDNLLGVLVRRQGLIVPLAVTVPATTVGEVSLGELWRHELRWARTIRALVPIEYGLSVLQHALAWAGLAVLLSGLAPWAIGLFLGAWAIRLGLAWANNKALGVAEPLSALFWLPPVRDMLSFAITFASYASDKVEWRGQTLRAEALPTPPPPGNTPL